MENPMTKWMIWGENPLFLETPICLHKEKMVMCFLFIKCVYERISWGLYPRDCLSGQKWTIYRAGPIRQLFLNNKTLQNCFQQQPIYYRWFNLTFESPSWKSPDIGCEFSLCGVCTTGIGTKHTKQIRQNTLQRGDLCGESIYLWAVEVSFVDARWPEWNTLISFTVFVTFTHHHLPSFPVISKLIIQNVIYLSLTIHRPTQNSFSKALSLLSSPHLPLFKGTFCHFFQHFPGQICSIASDPIHKKSWTETRRFSRFQHGRPTMHLFPVSSCSASWMQMQLLSTE